MPDQVAGRPLQSRRPTVRRDYGCRAYRWRTRRVIEVMADATGTRHQPFRSDSARGGERDPVSRGITVSRIDAFGKRLKYREIYLSPACRPEVTINLKANPIQSRRG